MLQTPVKPVGDGWESGWGSRRRRLQSRWSRRWSCRDAVGGKLTVTVWGGASPRLSSVGLGEGEGEGFLSVGTELFAGQCRG